MALRVVLFAVVALSACSAIFTAEEPAQENLSDAAMGALDGALDVDGGEGADAGQRGEADAAQGADAGVAGCDLIESDGTCVIDCADASCGDIQCPAGRPCRINCIGDQACETSMVDCSLATRCDITCMGQDACDMGVSCGGARCDVACDGGAACEDGVVDCTAAVCNIKCAGANSCASGVCCGLGSECNTDCSTSNSLCECTS